MSSEPASLAERTLRRERLIVAASLAVIVLLAWIYVLTGAGTGMNPSAMTTWRFPPDEPRLFGPAEWTLGYAALMIAMWWVMMIAMMVPSAAPMVLLYARIQRKNNVKPPGSDHAGAVAWFTGGYLAAWLGFSIIATVLQFALERSGLVDGMWMWSTNRVLTGALLIAAGLYQISRLKQACLTQCRSPAYYLAEHWRDGNFGALRMGAGHGLYCVGCCAGLMLLLFAGGIMNLIWIAGLSVLVIAEKLTPFGERLTPWIAGTLIGIGVYIALTAL